MRLAFDRLSDVRGDDDRLAAAYDKVLRDLFRNPFWKGGSTALRRIVWTDGKRARKEDRKAFRSPGVYLWGIDKRPLYVGITKGAFEKRFNRYIWSSRSPKFPRFGPRGRRPLPSAPRAAARDSRSRSA